MDSLYAFYEDIIYTKGDPRVFHYPLLGSPFPCLLILTAYLIFIKKIGPALMKDRPAYNIKTVIQVYNLIQIVMNAQIVLRGSYLIINKGDYRCINHRTTSEFDMKCVFYTWFYMLIKYIDLLDTVFFVLRKKFHLLSTLHVYHHTIMAIAGYLYAHYYPGGEMVLMGILNAFVHCFMYFYYFYCLYDDKAQNRWWKKHITHMQLGQFCLLFIWFTPKLFMTGCDYPKVLIFVMLTQCTAMIYMFGKFYYHAYIKEKKPNTSAKDVNGNVKSA